jgi:hypothetical protein
VRTLITNAVARIGFLAAVGAACTIAVTAACYFIRLGPSHAAPLPDGPPPVPESEHEHGEVAVVVALVSGPEVPLRGEVLDHISG